MINVVLTAIIGSVLIAGVAFGPLLSGQFHSAYAQNNTTAMSGIMTGNATTTMSANMTGNTNWLIRRQFCNNFTRIIIPEQWQVFRT